MNARQQLLGLGAAFLVTVATLGMPEVAQAAKCTSGEHIKEVTIGSSK